MFKNNFSYVLFLVLFLFLIINYPALLTILMFILVGFEVLFLLFNISSLYFNKLFLESMSKNEKLDFLTYVKNISFKNNFFEILPRIVGFNVLILYMLFVTQNIMILNFIVYLVLSMINEIFYINNMIKIKNLLKNG